MNGFLSFYWRLLKRSVSEFFANNLFTYSAAIAYYTIFSLPPMLLIILSIASKFYHEREVQTAVFDEIGAMVGHEGAQQLQATLENLRVFEPQWWATAISIVVLLFTSTTVFVMMQNVLNQIFQVKSAPSKSGIMIMLKDRVISFALVLVIAFLLIVSLFLNALLSAVQGYLESTYGAFPVMIADILSSLVPLLLTTIVFAFILRYLPDVKLAWKDTWFGAILITLLFAGGERLISLYIGNSSIANFYDTAGSIMVIMVWVFYASMIFLYGALITRLRVTQKGEKLKTTTYAVKIKEPEYG